MQNQQYFLIGAMLIIFYFFMIRPQYKKQKEHKNFLSNLKKGTEVVTIGGIYGTIYEVEEKFIVLEVDSKGTKIKVAIEAVSKTISPSK